MPPVRVRALAGRLSTAWVAVSLAGVLLLLPTLAPPAARAASTTMAPACAGVNLRTGTATSRPVMARLTTKDRVTVVAKVAGTAWSTLCSGPKSGSKWYRISHVNGKTVRALYGADALYAASGILVAVSTPVATPVATPAATPTAPAATTGDPLGAELMRLVNLDRAALGRPAFKIDAGLASIARNASFTCPTKPALVISGRAADLAVRDYFAHVVKGCYVAGTTTPYRSLDIVRSVFGYAEARSEILHWNTAGTASATYKLGCNIDGAGCAGGTTTTTQRVAVAQRNFMSSAQHRASELASYRRFGCGTAHVPGSTRTYFACLFADSASTVFSPTPSPTPTPSPSPDATLAPVPPSSPAARAASTTMAPACAGVNLRTGTATSRPVMARLTTKDRVTVVAKVAGTAWSTLCSGPKSGSKWYRISHVNGKTVRALYGADALYAASGILVAVSTPVATPVATPAATPAATPTTLGETVTFFGRGWGHGVGLSQYGARGRALAGQDAATILAHYYRGTTIGTIPADTRVRVLLLDDLRPTSGSPLKIRGLGGPWSIDGTDAVFPAGARLRLIPAPSGSATTWRLLVKDAAGAVLLDRAAPTDLTVRGTKPATRLKLPARSSTYNQFRGALRVIVAGRNVDVINDLPLESYLRGVVPAEMPSSWPVAARTAQTIAARSYAAYRLRPGVGTFDVFDDTRSQVYLGAQRETAAADAVIAATAGRVLRSGTSIANTLFHSTGGGATENNENVFTTATGSKVAGPVSYLRGSSDRDPDGAAYDAGAPHATWETAAYPLAQLSELFAADPRTAVGALTALDLRDRGVSGRLVSVTLIGSAGTKTVSGAVFIAVFNAQRPAGDPLALSTLLDTAPIP